MARVEDLWTFTADRGDDGVRLDLVLMRHLRGRVALSRRRLQSAIEGGAVKVNGSVATKTAGRVAAGDTLEARLPAPERREPPQPESVPLDILFEDDHLLAVNKCAGMVVHPSYKHSSGTLFNALLSHVTAGRPRLLNRLDKDTSGVVLVSKTKAAHAAIVRAMHDGAVRKEYLAVVTGVPKPPAGTIALRLKRDARDVRRVTVTALEGKESVTRYETLAVSNAEYPVPAASDTRGMTRLSLVLCELLTGRMHQIRVHLAARGCPIIGDRRYGASDIPVAFPRQALHAWRLSFAHPISREALTIQAPIPPDVRRLLEAAELASEVVRD